MHLTVLAVPLPQIRDQIIDVIKVIPEEWMSKRIVQQIVDVPVPQILEEIVALVAGEVVCNARTGVRRQHGWTCPQPPPPLRLCGRSWWLERGPYSCLAMMKMKVKHIHVCHSHCCINCRRQPLLLNASVIRSKPQLFITFPWNGSSLVERVRR